MIQIIDLLGVGVFAISGALLAGRKQMDLFGVLVLALITGIGGGTLRDLLLGVPVFWINQPVYIVVGVGAALATVILARFWVIGRLPLLMADAVGLSFFCVLGAAKALEADAGPIIITLMGVMTGVFGGVLRDILAGDIPLVLRHDLYATCAVVGAGCFEILMAAGAAPVVAIWVGMLSALALRLAAIRWHLGLPMVSLK